MIGISQGNREQEAGGGRQSHEQAGLGRKQTLDVGGGGLGSESDGLGRGGIGLEDPGRAVPTDDGGGRAGGGVVEPLDGRIAAQFCKLNGGALHGGGGGRFGNRNAQAGFGGDHPAIEHEDVSRLDGALIDDVGDGTAEALGGNNLDGHGRLAHSLEAALGEESEGGAAAQVDVGAFDGIDHHGQTAPGGRRLAEDGLGEARRATHGGLLHGAVRAHRGDGAGENAVHRFGGVTQRLSECPGESAVRAAITGSNAGDLVGFLVGLGGGQGEHAERFGIDGAVGDGIGVGRIVGDGFMERDAGSAGARAAVGAGFAAGVPGAAGQGAAVATIRDKGDDDAFAGGGEEDARDFLVADIGDVAPVVGGNQGLILLLLFGAGEVLDVVAVAGIVEKAEIAGLGVVNQVFLKGLEDGVGGGVLVLEEDEILETEALKDVLNEVNIVDGAVQVVESPVLSVAFDGGAFDRGRFQIAQQLGLGGGVGIVIINAHQDGPARLSIQGGTEGQQGKYQ